MSVLLDAGKKLGQEVQTLQQQLSGTYTGPERTWEDVYDTASYAVQSYLSTLPAEQKHSAPQAIERVAVPPLIPTRRESLPPPPVPRRTVSLPVIPPAPAYIPRAPYRQPGYYITSQRDLTAFGTQAANKGPRRW